MNVFLVTYAHDYTCLDLVGIYQSRKNAEEAIASFADKFTGMQIYEVEIGNTHSLDFNYSGADVSLMN